MRHPHRHRSFAPAMRGQRPALASVLAWLALLAMLFTGLPVLERTLSGSAALVLQQPAEDRPASGGETTPQEETPAKPRRTAAARTASAPQPPRLQPQDALYSLMASLVARPPQASPAIVSAPATPLPAAPGLRVQRGQAPPPG
ncbi:hypothetical protein [Stenotrophomonas sp.]|uniref:hypothetical protein n=1 Tax=Stenotrophomonas sp. TaxID=69392 RepID=UPI002FC89DC3